MNRPFRPTSQRESPITHRSDCVPVASSLRAVTFDAFEAKAGAEGITKSELIRRLIEEYLAK